MVTSVLRVLRLSSPVAYAEAVNTMEALSAALETGGRGGVGEDTLLLVEHAPVYTLGKRGSEDDLGAGGAELLRETGADVIHSKRGGEVTFHGPGQAVFYPIVQLRRLAAGRGVGARRYVEALEDSMLAAAGAQGLSGAIGRVRDAPGVFVEDGRGGRRKLGAVGVRISKGVATHGSALNVSTDLKYFEKIVACGLPDVAATSLERELGRCVSMTEVQEAFVEHLARELGYSRVAWCGEDSAKLSDLLLRARDGSRIPTR